MSRAVLDDDTAERLAKIAGMFGSAHDGERAAAALKFDGALKAEGLTASELLEGYSALLRDIRRLEAALASHLSMPRGDAGPRGWMRKPSHLQHQSKAAECLACLTLSEWEWEFLQSITQATTLSPKQSACLSRIYARLEMSA